MEFKSCLDGSPGWVRDFPVYDATELVIGEALMLGTTAETDLGAAITAYTGSSAEAVDFVGMSMEASTPTVLMSAGGQRKKVQIHPFVVYLIEYDLTTTMAVATYTAGTRTITVTSGEDNIDGSWFYTVGGTGSGQLAYVDTAAAASYTIDAAFATAIDNTTTLIKILRQGHLLTALNTAATKLKTQAAAGSGVSINIISNWYKDDFSGGLVELDPDTLQAGIANLSNPKFYAEVIFIDHFMVRK